jgi:hypothetical protein
MAELDLDTVVVLHAHGGATFIISQARSTLAPEMQPRQARIRLSAYAWMHAIACIAIHLTCLASMDCSHGIGCLSIQTENNKPDAKRALQEV